MTYKLDVCEERNAFFCRWNVLFQEKSKQGRLIELKVIGLLKKKIQRLPVEVKDMEFPGVLKKEHVKIPGVN